MVNKKTAFLFPGQGSQFSGMALDFYEASSPVRELFELAGDIMGQDMKKLLGESSEDILKQTDIAQPAVSLANLSAARILSERGVRPYAAAGHSLGEFAALAVAGIISEADCFKIVKERGKLMQNAISGLSSTGEGAGHAPFGMAAVIGLPPEKVESLINEWTQDGLCGLFAANFNSGRQTVVSGTDEALTVAEKYFKESGARRFIRLNVSGPFHSPFMEEASSRFSVFLKSICFNDPKIPFFSNVSGKEVKIGEEARSLAVTQIKSPVRWTEEEAEIAKLPLDAVLEAGPGTVLAGLWKDTGSGIPCLPAGTYLDIENLAAFIN
ncbi:MAG: ACP S-malonyltransferase [Spirochaetaceae bacterium]|jgi:[acyl-carrier-protein] S-malonyltransferase|nr:ACP S-malonyltransferase [Spirochaetaceae bacterium]